MVEPERPPTECAGHILRGGTFRECAGCSLECAARQVNVPGVRMYVSAGLGLSRSFLHRPSVLALSWNPLITSLCTYTKTRARNVLAPGHRVTLTNHHNGSRGDNAGEAEPHRVVDCLGRQILVQARRIKLQTDP